MAVGPILTDAYMSYYQSNCVPMKSPTLAQWFLPSVFEWELMFPTWIGMLVGFLAWCNHGTNQCTYSLCILSCRLDCLICPCLAALGERRLVTNKLRTAVKIAIDKSIIVHSLND